MERTYECKVKTDWCTFQQTIKIEFDKSNCTIKEAEQELKEHMAEHFSFGKYQFTAENVKLKRVKEG